MGDGPIPLSFFVFSDFMNYRSGIYSRTKGTALVGGHAVKLVGWGSEDEQDYWLVQNSWSNKRPSWGENGFFRIRRGVNECGFEQRMVRLPASQGPTPPAPPPKPP